MDEPRWTSRIDATGSGGNVFAVIGTARRYMREIGLPRAEIDDMTSRAQNAGSYDEALAVVREWFPVDTDGDED